MIEMVFIWPEGEDRALTSSVLASVLQERERHGRFRRWKAFGMDLLTSKDLTLENCKAEPTRVCMTFAAPDEPGRWETFERLAMVDQWLDGTLGEWLSAQTPHSVRAGPPVSNRTWGHDIETTRGEKAVSRLRRLTGRRIGYESSAWICPADGRLYRASSLGPSDERGPGPEWAGKRLSCCKELALVL